MADNIISSAMRLLAGLPEHPATERVVRAARFEKLIKALLPCFPAARAIAIRYGDPKPIHREDGGLFYSEDGELIIKFYGNLSKIASGEAKVYINRLDVNGDQMLRDDGTWGWAVNPPLMDLEEALAFCFGYVKGSDREILSFDIRHTYYREN
jgi:hypothetical protein